MGSIAVAEVKGLSGVRSGEARMPDYDFTTLSPYDFELLCRDLLQEELGVRLSPFGNLTVKFGSGAVPPLLTILGKKDERRSV